MVKFLSCFGEKQKAALDEENLIEGQKPGCVFCVVSREKGFDIIEEVRWAVLESPRRDGTDSRTTNSSCSVTAGRELPNTS